MVKVKEIFTSIQGEGPYIGYKQLFIRFCGCNLNCSYCDTDFDAIDAKECTADELLEIISRNSDCHSVSLTGGEPLIHSEFLLPVVKQSALPVYLETNGTLYRNLEEIIDYVTYISADIKLPASTGGKAMWEEHDKFFEIAKTKKLFAKSVFNQDITQEEIIKMCELCKKHNIELILQPMMHENKPSVDSEFMEKTLNSCLKIYTNVRLIPQVHKFLNII